MSLIQATNLQQDYAGLDPTSRDHHRPYPGYHTFSHFTASASRTTVGRTLKPEVLVNSELQKQLRRIPWQMVLIVLSFTLMFSASESKSPPPINLPCANPGAIVCVHGHPGRYLQHGSLRSQSKFARELCSHICIHLSRVVNFLDASYRSDQWKDGIVVTDLEAWGGRIG